MKKIVFLIAGALLFTSAQAQKGNVGKAESLFTKGDMAAAKAEIDIATTIEKNTSKSKTWLAKGKIYKAIARSEDPAVSGLAPANEAIKIAAEAFNKSKSLEAAGSVNYNLVDFEVEDFWGTYLNKGGEVYGTDDYPAAYDLFYKASLIKPTDSLTLFYAGVAAHQAKFVKETIEMYMRLMEQGDANQDVYSSVVYIERVENKDDEKALAIVQKAKVAYPNNSDFIREEINILIALERADDAIKKLELAVEKEPDNTQLYLNLASLYDNLGSKAENTQQKDAYLGKAETNYEKTIGLDPKNFIGNFNLGVIWVNRAKVFYDQARDMDLKTYQKEGNKVVEEGNKLLAKSVPYLETAYAAQGQDCSVMVALQSVYSQLKKNDKAEALSKAQEAAGCD